CQALDGIRDATVTGVQTWALPICPKPAKIRSPRYCQFAVYRSFGGWTRAEKILQVIAYPHAKRCFAEWSIGALAHFDRPLDEKQIGRASCRERVESWVWRSASE